MTDSPVLELDDSNGEKLVETSALPVFAMFFSLPCPSCRTIEPSFRAYAEEYDGTVSFGRPDILASPWISERYGVLSTPTFVVFCAGKPFQLLADGFYPALLKRMVEEALSQGTECMKRSTAISSDISGYG
ncbi:MAG: thioredoxin family protein [Methanoregulaceae archaeon]|nr:thioredoxin family protein [Methanoregulaceae archaeon]